MADVVADGDGDDVAAGEDDRVPADGLDGPPNGNVVFRLGVGVGQGAADSAWTSTTS